MAAAEEINIHLNRILDQVAKQQNIENYEAKLNTEAKIGDGFAAQFYQGEILNKNTEQTLNVIIKRAPLWDFDCHILFVNETLFYGKSYPVLDGLQKEAKLSTTFENIPKYFGGDITDKKEYIVMEDMKKLGYVMLDKKQYLDEQHLEMIFKTYGKFHALSFVLRHRNLAKYESITKDYVDVGPMIIKFATKQIVTAVCAAVSALNSERDKTVFEELENLGNRAMDLFIQAHEYKGKHRCLVHGDCWSNNMLFKYSESGKLLEIKLIDFQLSQDNTPINDLSYCFYSGASKKDFDKLDDYLELYHQSFSEFSKELGGDPDELLPLEILKEEWKEYSLYGLIFGIHQWQLKLTPREIIEELLTGINEETQSKEESFKIMDRVLEDVHRTDLYKERTTDILRHAVQYGILSKKRILRNKE